MEADVREEHASGWVFWGYTVGIFLVSVLILPWLLWKIVSVKNRRTAFLERMGLRGWQPTVDIIRFGLENDPSEELFDEMQFRFAVVWAS